MKVIQFSGKEMSKRALLLVGKRGLALHRSWITPYELSRIFGIMLR
jgi:hypothetical protein